MRPFLLLALCATAVIAHPGWGIVVDSRGDIWFTDVIQNRVLRLDAARRLHVERTGIHSHHLWLAPDGSVHGEHLWYDPSTEKFPSYPWRITPRGVFEKLASSPDRVLRDDAGNRFIASRDRVERLSPDGRRTALGGLPFAGIARGQYERLLGLALDPHGDLYVADLEHGVLRRLTPDGRLHDHWKSGFNWTPWGVTWHQGSLYVLEHSRHLGTRTRILQVTGVGQGRVIWSD